MEFIVFFAIVGAIAALPALGFARGGLPGTGCGLGFCIAVGITASAIWFVSGMSEQPRNEIGHPRRVHVRNDSAEVVYRVDVFDLENTSTRLDPVDPGELAIISGAYHPKYEDQACTDEPEAIVKVAPGAASRDELGQLHAAPSDITVVAEIETCYPKGRNIVVWDGNTAFVDPDARPPLVDPEDEPLVYGWLIAGASLAAGIAFDVLVRRRRRRPAATAAGSAQL